MFVTIALMHMLACFSPGPALLHALNILIKYDINKATRVLVGITMCNGLEIILSIFGISFLVLLHNKMPLIFDTTAGLIIIYLGASNLRKNNKTHKKNIGKKGNFITQGFILTLFNPKALLFWPFILTPLVLEYNLFQKVLVILYFTVTTFVFLYIIVYLSSKPKSHFTKYLGYIQKFLGLVMVLFGIVLIWHTISKVLL